MSALPPLGALLAGFWLACKTVQGWAEPWKACRCAGRKCVRCRWTGKRPRVLARVVRRAKLREEGWLR